MKKVFSFSILLSIWFSGIFAAPITQSEAFQRAQRFTALNSKGIAQNAPAAPRTLALAYSCAEIERFSAVDPFFYVFNYENNTGFVIVSGDDRTREILAYADSGNFDSANIPDNMLNFLSMYAGEISALTDDYIPSFATENQTLATAVSPLVQTRWNQDLPYYNLCPIDNSSGARSYTGCVATTMAQIMKYHNFPAQGTGSHSYTLYNVSGTLSARFDTTFYDWVNMRNTYSSPPLPNAVQRNAVATLMYHCGVAVDMQYSSEGSGAYSQSVVYALKTYFGYDEGTRLYVRDFFSTAAWDSIVRVELDASRPLYYAGQSNSGGHAFVCDGYNANGYFHINWGWGGYYDGYFQLSALDPQGQGIGGGSGGYNYNQEIIVGIQPAQSGSEQPVCELGFYEIYANQNTVSDINQNFTLYINTVRNISGGNGAGYVGLALYDSQMNELGYFSGEDYIRDLTANVGYFGSFYYDNFSMAGTHGFGVDTLAAGEYRIYPTFSVADAPYRPYSFLTAAYGYPEYLAFTVADDGSITFTGGSSGGNEANLVCNSLYADENLKTDETGNFSFSITNTGTGDYDGNIMLYISDNMQSLTVYSNSSEHIGAGQSVTRNLLATVALPAGTYYMLLLYENNENLDILAYQIITVEEEGVDMPNLTCSVLQANGTLTSGSTGNFTVTVTNTGTADYASYLPFLMVDVNAASIDDILIISENIERIAAGETRTFNFSTAITLSAGNYILAVGYDMRNDSTVYWGDSNYYNTLRYVQVAVQQPAAVETADIEPIAVYPNPAVDKLIIEGKQLKIENILIFDLTGQEVLNTVPITALNSSSIDVSGLPSGIYLLKLKTENGTKTLKFSKK